MKTVWKWVSGLLAAIAPVMLAVSCTVDKTPEFYLNGTWESTNTSLYSGRLKIDSDTITITGYAESQTPPTWENGNDAERPFRDFARNMPLAYYEEDGKLFILTVGTVGGGDYKSVPYVYSTKGQDKFLLFDFGGKPEALRRTGG